MPSYKAEVTLNEKDTVSDMLNFEKNLVKVYAEAVTEGCSKGFRTLIKQHLNETIGDQLSVFLTFTELGYDRVESAPETETKKQKLKFAPVKKELSKKKPS